jgi:hypothetical protein
MTKREKQLLLVEQVLKCKRVKLNQYIIENPGRCQGILIGEMTPAEVAEVLTADRIPLLDYGIVYSLSREQAAALSTNQITAILFNKSVIEDKCMDVLLRKLSVSQIQSLPIKVINLVVRSQVREVCNYFDFSEFTQNLTRSQVQGIPSSRIDSVFWYLSEEQKTWLSPGQINCLSDSHLYSLPICRLSQYQVESLSGNQLRHCFHDFNDGDNVLTYEQITWLSDKQLSAFTAEMLNLLDVRELEYIKERLY